MRAIFIFLISISLIDTICAQDSMNVVYDQHNDDIKTLFGDHRIVHGGYGAFSFGYSLINNLNAAAFGGRGACIIGHWLALGAGGTGFISDMTYNAADNQYTSLTGGYGGLIVEPIILPWFPVHISLPILLGGGGIANVITNDNGSSYEPPNIDDATSFFIVEPGAELEFNIVKHFRLSLGISYRFTDDIILRTIQVNYPLNGWSGNLVFKFGQF